MTKTLCKALAAALLWEAAPALLAAVPVAWTNAPSMPPFAPPPVPHGVPIDFRVTLKGYTEPLIAPGADLHLWFQTNGMGKLWWPAPATLDGDTITASFGPEQDTGADRVSLFFGAPSNVFASAVLRLTHSPGFVPNALPLPTPVLDFAAVEIQNLAALTNGWAFGGGEAPDLSNYPTFEDMDREITIRLAATNACISVSNGVQRIYELDGTNRTLKWEWDMGFAAVSNQVRTLVAQMLRKIEDTHTWSDYAASGISNQFNGATMLDRGSVYFGSTNVQWTAANGFAVMTCHLPVVASGSASQFRIGVNGDDWFGMETTAAYLVDAHSDSFNVAPGANGTKTATITTDYDASYESAPPVVYYSVSLTEPFAELSSGVAWLHNADTHVSTVTIQGLTAPSGFFTLRRWNAGGAIMRSTMPIFPEGYRVEDGNSQYVGTLQPDSIITITQGGKTYRVMAQEVK